MAVTFTPNIGLAKVTESELALNWARSAELQEDNNLIIIDETDVNLVAYTPVITATTTPPNVGAGVRKGEYQEAQGFIFGNFVLEFLNPGVIIGTGEYAVSLPFVADNVYHTVGTNFTLAPGTNSCIGEGYIFNDSSVNTSGTLALDVVTVAGVSYVRLVPETFIGKTDRLVRDNMPFGLDTLDRISGQFFYKKL